MRFVGIDPSLSRTGMCALSENDVLVQSKAIPKTQAVYERQTGMLAAVSAFVQKGDIVMLEDFGVAARFAAAGKYVERVELCGMLKLIIKTHLRCPVLLAPPTMLKSFIVGKGNADKFEVFVTVTDRWHVPVKDDDQADAFSLAALGRAYFNNVLGYEKLFSKFEKYSGNWATIRRLRFLGIV